MKPFLILQLRKNDEAADGEYQAFLKHGGLSEEEVQRVRMEKTGIPFIDLDDYSAVIVGGGPTDVCSPDSQKSFEEIRFEEQLRKLISEITERDFPYLGCCYGLGS
ncbi:MAG: glutamine amidotransferase, partial [bacterium]|nr:glutamine amidotransferase [bacterium]